LKQSNVWGSIHGQANGGLKPLAAPELCVQVRAPANRESLPSIKPLINGMARGPIVLAGEDVVLAGDDIVLAGDDVVMATAILRQVRDSIKDGMYSIKWNVVGEKPNRRA
jgi:hypothetical protein